MYSAQCSVYHKSIAVFLRGVTMLVRREAVGSVPVPPQAYFVVSALFHYLGPAFAVLLFARLDVLGVAWLRIASAAAIFAIWRRPWRIVASRPGVQRTTLLALGAALGLMNAC